MKRIVIYSTPTETNIDKILDLTFPSEIQNKVFAYMPSDGDNCPQKYYDEWEGNAEKYGAKFLYIDNSIENAKSEMEKLLSANIMMISGGNTFRLMRNLRRSGLDEAVKEFSRKEEFVMSCCSAGALVLTPTINVCNLPNYDENLVGLKDLTGLNIVDFEIFPHYSEKYAESLKEYIMTTGNEVREITDEGYNLIDN